MDWSTSTIGNRRFIRGNMAHLAFNFQKAHSITPLNSFFNCMNCNHAITETCLAKWLALDLNAIQNNLILRGAALKMGRGIGSRKLCGLYPNCDWEGFLFHGYEMPNISRKHQSALLKCCLPSSNIYAVLTVIFHWLNVAFSI